MNRFSCTANWHFSDLSATLFDKLIEKYEPTELYIYEHTPDDGSAKHHCHYVFETKYKNEDKIRKQIREWIQHLPDCKPKSIQVGKWIDDVIFTYMSKGMFDPIVKIGTYTDFQLQALKQAYKPMGKKKAKLELVHGAFTIVPEGNAVPIEITDNKVNRVTKWDLYEEMEAELDSKGPEAFKDWKLRRDAVVGVLRKWRQKYSIYTVRDYSYMLLDRSDPYSDYAEKNLNF